MLKTLRRRTLDLFVHLSCKEVVCVLALGVFPLALCARPDRLLLGRLLARRQVSVLYAAWTRKARQGPAHGRRSPSANTYARQAARARPALGSMHTTCARHGDATSWRASHLGYCRAGARGSRGVHGRAAAPCSLLAALVGQGEQLSEQSGLRAGSRGGRAASMRSISLYRIGRPRRKTSIASISSCTIFVASIGNRGLCVRAHPAGCSATHCGCQMRSSQYVIGCCTTRHVCATGLQLAQQGKLDHHLQAMRDHDAHRDLSAHAQCVQAIRQLVARRSSLRCAIITPCMTERISHAAYAVTYEAVRARKFTLQVDLLRGVLAHNNCSRQRNVLLLLSTTLVGCMV